MTPQSPVTHRPSADPSAERRTAARRTALVVAGIAVAVYAGFILLNVVAR